MRSFPFVRPEAPDASARPRRIRPGNGEIVESEHRAFNRHGAPVPRRLRQTMILKRGLEA